MIGEELECLGHGHLQDLVNILTAEMDVEHAAFVAHALALFANQLDVGEELHLDLHRALTLAGLAASPGNVERKMSGGVAALLRLRCGGEQSADVVERAD